MRTFLRLTVSKTIPSLQRRKMNSDEPANVPFLTAGRRCSTLVSFASYYSQLQVCHQRKRDVPFFFLFLAASSNFYETLFMFDFSLSLFLPSSFTLLQFHSGKPLRQSHANQGGRKSKTKKHSDKDADTELRNSVGSEHFPAYTRYVTAISKDSFGLLSWDATL